MVDTFKSIEYVLIAIIVIGFFYSGYHVINKSQVPNFSQYLSMPKPMASPTFVQNKPYEWYASQIQGRNIFTLTLDKTPQILGMLPANLKVVGILLGDHPQVVLEDSALHKSYFVAEQANEGMSIKEIQEDKIILDYQGTLVEVALKGAQ